MYPAGILPAGLNITIIHQEGIVMVNFRWGEGIDTGDEANDYCHCAYIKQLSHFFLGFGVISGPVFIRSTAVNGYRILTWSRSMPDQQN